MSPKRSDPRVNRNTGSKFVVGSRIPHSAKRRGRSSEVTGRNPVDGGFTLIELMIVVGIIGILVSISVPAFNKYQRKARQSEAKIALSSMYGLQKSFYAEYSSYIPALDAIGYAPEGDRRFYSHEACVNDAWSGTVTGYAGTAAVNGYSRINSPYAYTYDYASINNCITPTWECSGIGSNPQAINSIAIGQLANGIRTDVWVMNHLKILRNCSPGL